MAMGDPIEGGAQRRPRLIGAILLTLTGLAVLGGLCVWQVQRLGWKEALIARLEAQLSAPPAPLPAHPDPARDEFRRFTVTGAFTGERGAHGFSDAAYLTTMRPHGAGYRLVQPFLTEDKRLILVDRGYVPLDQKNRNGKAAKMIPATPGRLTLTGALRWPQPADSFAEPGAGAAENIWLTRSVEVLAPLWGAEPVLLVSETPTAQSDWPRPVQVSVKLPNDHLEYAITWGSLATIWAVIGGLMIRREWRLSRAA